jgi:hypothetical protein
MLHQTSYSSISERNMIMKVRMYVILKAAIEAGIDSGYINAYKYEDDPSVYKIKQNINDEIWEALNEIIDFNGDN